MKQENCAVVRPYRHNLVSSTGNSGLPMQSTPKPSCCAMARAELESLIPSVSAQMKVLQQLNAFNNNEIKAIKNHRNFYEKTFARDKFSCEDILMYVRYELDLLAVIREIKVEDSLLKSKNMVMYSSANLLNRLFSILTGYFPEKIQLWLLYVEFCREMKDTITLLRVMDNLIKVHQDKPFVHQLAARVAREDLKNLGKARAYLLAGIRTLIDSPELYREAFLMELAVCRQRFENSSEKNPKKDDPVFWKTLDHVYSAARNKIHSVGFYIDLFHSLKGLPFAKTLENRIHDDLRKRFPKEEVMWDTLANVKYEQLKIPENALNSRTIIVEVIKIYTTAIEDHLNTRLMWSLYIDRLLQIYNDESIEGLTNFKKNIIIEAFNSAHREKQLSEKHYYFWADMQKDEERKLILLKIATQNLPRSVTLWMKIFSNRLTAGDEAEACRLFEEALACFRNDKKASLPLWKFMSRYYQIAARPDRARWIFDKAISEGSGVGEDMKPVYLEWVTLSQGIIAGRDLYNKIAPKPPFSMALHAKMMELENYQVKLNVRSMRRCHALAAEQFGSHDPVIWMKWIQFENSYGKLKKHVLTIKDKAMSVLQPALIDEFSSELRLFEIECLTSWKRQAAIQELQRSLNRPPNRKRGSSTPARYNGKSKKVCS